MKNKKGIFPILLGLLLLAAALFLTAYNVYDARRAEKAANLAVSRLEELIPTQAPTKPAGSEMPTVPVEIPDYVLNPQMPMPETEIDGETYIGTLQIPALGLNLPVISQCSYPKLKIAPNRYFGSAYLDNLVIAGHNYDCFFGGISNLSPGDTVRFTDLDGNVFRYEVVALEELKVTAIEEMLSPEYDLTLFTCNTSLSGRITVRCERIEE